MKKKPNDAAIEPHEITHINDALRGFCIQKINPTKEIINNEKNFNFEVEKPLNKDYGEEIVVL